MPVSRCFPQRAALHSTVSVSVSYTLCRVPYLALSQSVSVSCSVCVVQAPHVTLSLSFSIPLDFGAPSFTVSLSLQVSDTLSLALYLLPDPVLALVWRAARTPLQWQTCKPSTTHCYITNGH